MNWFLLFLLIFYSQILFDVLVFIVDIDPLLIYSAIRLIYCSFYANFRSKICMRSKLSFMMCTTFVVISRKMT